jgi:hypothetical protein
MYYDQSTEAKTQPAGGISLGPFLITPEQVIFFVNLLN